MNNAKPIYPLITDSMQCELILNIIAHEDLDDASIAHLSRQVLNLNHAHISQGLAKYEK